MADAVGELHGGGDLIERDVRLDEGIHLGEQGGEIAAVLLDGLGRAGGEPEDDCGIVEVGGVIDDLREGDIELFGGEQGAGFFFVGGEAAEIDGVGGGEFPGGEEGAAQGEVELIAAGGPRVEREGLPALAEGVGGEGGGAEFVVVGEGGHGGGMRNEE